jgi:tetratricopeptide (TPR) repeat protein
MTRLQDALRTARPLPGLASLKEIHKGPQDVVHVDPDNPNAYFILGMVAHREGRNPSALDYITRAVGLDAKNPDYHYGLAVTLRALGRVEDAVSSLNQALALHPGHGESQHEMGTILAGQGRLEDGAAYLRQALANRPDLAEAQADLGAVLARLGRVEESETALQHTLRLRPDDPNVYKQLGGAAMLGGRHDEAIQHYRRAIEARPDDADSHNDLGIALARIGHHDQAISSYREALRHRPDFADAHNNLGNALRGRGKLDEAITCFQEALRLRPVYPEAHNNLGITFRAKGKHDEAINFYRHALEQRPNYAEAHNNLGFALADRGKHEAAIFCYHQAARLKKDYFEAHHNLGNALSELGRIDDAITTYREALRIRPKEPRVLKCLGVAHSRKEKLDEAVDFFRQALKIRPDSPDILNDLAITLSRQTKYQEALAAYDESIRLRPNYAEAHSNRGNALRNLGRFEESLACYQRAIELRPNYADAHNNQGIALAEMGRFDDAIVSYTKCIQLRPQHVDAHMNRALTWLRKGDYAQGWAEYEWRWRKRPMSNRALIQPQWNGFPLAGRTILLITEQGFGDVLQFIRYARILKEQGARVVFECPDRLVKLVGGCPGIDQIIPQGQPLPDYDVFAPLLTIPGLVGTSVEAIPTHTPYVNADPALVEKWRTELSSDECLKVGINWQGNPKYAGDRHRSIPLTFFEPLSRVPGVKLFSIQKNDGYDQLSALNGRFPVVDLGARLDNEAGPFMDTAAVMTNLDLFITSDTAVAHLAGALGVPTWMAVSTTPDWRWMTRREDCPWYPSLRLFRQTEHMTWGPVFARLASELRKLVPASLPTRSVVIEASPGELIDKITILRIKSERMTDPDKLRHVRAELAKLEDSRERTVIGCDELSALEAELHTVNGTLWEVEDSLRSCERSGNFGPQFVELARSVYKHNDRRADLKRRINVLLKSDVMEEKSYTDDIEQTQTSPTRA